MCALDLSRHPHSTAMNILPAHSVLDKGEGGTNTCMDASLAIQKKIARIAFPTACAWGSVHLWGSKGSSTSPPSLAQRYYNTFWSKQQLRHGVVILLTGDKGPTPLSRAPFQQDHCLGGHGGTWNLFTKIDALTVFQEQMLLKHGGSTSRLNPALNSLITWSSSSSFSSLFLFWRLFEILL